MKLKCQDGIVRNFQVAIVDMSNFLSEDQEAMCLHCGKSFGFHSTKILKPLFVSHTCEVSNDR